MIIMPVPKDIRTVKPKFIGVLTKRQTFALAPAIVIGLFLNYMFAKLDVPTDLSMVLSCIIVAPIILCGFIDICGMPFAIYIRDVALVRWLAPKCRPYVTENSFDKLAVQNKITYEYFDGDDKEYTEKEMKKKRKLNQKRLEKYLKKNPDMKPIQ